MYVGSRPMADQKHHVTDEHFAGFGMIVNLFAEIETFLDEMIVAITKADPAFIVPLLTFLSMKNKRDYIAAMVNESVLSDNEKRRLEKIFSKIHKRAATRNNIAHWGWKPGKKPGTIKPFFLSARGVLKMLGIEHNEKEWTAGELKEEAAKIQNLCVELIRFMNDHELRANIVRNTE